MAAAVAHNFEANDLRDITLSLRGLPNDPSEQERLEEEQICESKAGSCVALDFQGVLKQIEEDLLVGVLEAPSYPLHEACELSPHVLDYCERTLRSQKGWNSMMNIRIGATYKAQDRRLVWLDDKVEQVQKISNFFGGRELHLPIYGRAAANDLAAPVGRQPPPQQLSDQDHIAYNIGSGADSAGPALGTGSDASTVEKEEGEQEEGGAASDMTDNDRSARSGSQKDDHQKEAILSTRGWIPLTASEAQQVESLRRCAQVRLSRGESIVIKPRHGSNSKFIAVFDGQYAQATASDANVAIDAALTAFDKSWKKESWNQNAVPKGALIQPMYRLMSSFLVDAPTSSSTGEGQSDHSARLDKPLELKVQTLFGKVVGACLNTHPHFLWVFRDGSLHIWDERNPQLLRRGHGTSERLPEAILRVLQCALKTSWNDILRASEHIARSAGLDELRVDWLLGDAEWGPRVGELTYLGTFALDVVPACQRLARAFAWAHLARSGKLDEPLNSCFAPRP